MPTVGEGVGSGAAGRVARMAWGPLAWVPLVAALLLGAPLVGDATAQTLPPGFQDITVFSGLTQPAVVAFSPDGRVFVAEKSGLVKDRKSVV